MENIEILNTPFILDIYGYLGNAENKDYESKAFQLMDKMWKSVKSNNIKNKGRNIWVYEPNESVFAGVELEETPLQETGLEHKSIHLIKYAYYKHIGAYHLIKQVGLSMKEELTKKGFEIISPYIEIYGHWSPDESKLETEIIMNLK